MNAAESTGWNLSTRRGRSPQTAVAFPPFSIASDSLLVLNVLCVRKAAGVTIWVAWAQSCGLM